MAHQTLLVTMCDLSHQAVRQFAPGETRILMIESGAKRSALPFHRKKLVLGLSAMRHFARELQRAGYRVDYRAAGTFAEGLRQHVADFEPQRLLAFDPREWGMRQILLNLQSELPLDLLPDPFFLISRGEFQAWAGGRTTLVMEPFYRMMRVRENILLDERGRPVGGQWNFDKENRKPPRRLALPEPPWVEPDGITQEIMRQIEAEPGHWGSVNGFRYPVTRAQAVAWLDHFLEHRLALFGPFEDAMLSGQLQVTHSMISAFLNLGLVHPREVVRRALDYARERPVPLNSLEGFVRQIVGWREYVNGVYWLKMPAYRQSNYLRAARPLPRWYWEPEGCDLACLRDSILMVKEHGFAHHIHRLMVLSNLAVLTEVNPLRLSEWFWAAFVDAYEWVELTNVLGMAMFADGGVGYNGVGYSAGLATKPYISTGNYIHRMSDYCASCRYEVKQKTGDQACPFNYLYWAFLRRHRSALENSGRMGLAYRQVDRKSDAEWRALEASTEAFLKRLEPASDNWAFAYDQG